MPMSTSLTTSSGMTALELTCLPAYILNIKVGRLIMVVRSLEPPMPTNVMRCIVTRFCQNLIEATIICGPYKREVIFLPKIPLIPSLSRHSSSTSVIINQTILCHYCEQVSGPDFQDHWSGHFSLCFSHGMFYVVAFRPPVKQTRNVMYQEAPQ